MCCSACCSVRMFEWWNLLVNSIYDLFVRFRVCCSMCYSACRDECAGVRVAKLAVSFLNDSQARCSACCSVPLQCVLQCVLQ